MATKLLTDISQDEKERAIFRSRRMYQSDLESNIRTAILIGEERGDKKLENKLNEIVTSLKRNNVPIIVISSSTGLSVEAIEKI